MVNDMYVCMYVCMYVLYFAYVNKNHYSVFKKVCMYVCMNDLVLHSGKKLYYLLVEGYGIQDVMGCPGVDGR